MPALPPPDDGRPDPRLAAALSAYDGSARSRAEVLAALSGARVFLALAAVATGTQVGESGLRRESSAQMSLMGLVSAAGTRALPAFTDGHAVQRWQPGARPVAIPGAVACSSALDDGADALLLDPAGPAVAVGRDELTELAAGRVPVPGAALSTRLGGLGGALRTPERADPALLVALGEALAGEPVRAAVLLQGPHGPVLGVQADLAAAALVSLAGRVRERLGAALPDGGLDLAQVPPGSGGVPVPLPPPRRRFLRDRLGGRRAAGA